MRVYILYAKENWITDQLVKEWIVNNKKINTSKFEEADIIWIISNYILDTIPINKYKNKKVITTIHHITPWKMDYEKKKHYHKLDSITDIYHSICVKTTQELKKYTTKKIITIPFWNNETIWKFLNNKQTLRKNFKLNTNDFLIGSFQRDTEGNSINNKKYLPKLEKGPDIFIEVIKILKEKHKNLKVILTGSRREYIRKELDKLKVKYFYFEMCNFDKLNKLYNCLDLYIVSSRVEGGPRAINECSLVQTPLLSTQVGISELICHPDSLFDMNKPNSILDCKTNIEYNYNKVQEYTISKYMNEFNRILFN